MAYKPELLTPTAHDIDEYWRLFVNQDAYTQMKDNRVEPSTNSYYRPRVSFASEEYRKLTKETVRRHLRGDITCMFYAINPITQTCKWICLDADYVDAARDLERIQTALKGLGVESLLEDSRRGGHLWIMNATPLLALDCRRFINYLVRSLDIPLAASPADPPGIEVFPRQDLLEDGRLGNGIRGPLGVHRKVFQRFWFVGAERTLISQLELVAALPPLTSTKLLSLLASIPSESLAEAVQRPMLFRSNRSASEFSILTHFPPPSSTARDYKARCPVCTERRLVITAVGTRRGFYKCFSGCSTKQIRAALGHPVVYKGA
jgi:hypothetical protein